MTLTPSQMCFGLNNQLDQQSFSLFLQLAGRQEFAETLASRLSSDEIDDAVNSFMALIKQHLSEDEYHKLFLGDTHSHQTKEEEDNG